MWRLRAWWFHQDDTRRMVYKALAVGAAVPLLLALIYGESLPALLLQVGAEVVGAGVTFALLDHFLSRGEAPQAREPDPARLKADLIGRLGSSVRKEAISATEELRRLDWLSDGSLHRAFLHEANLQEAALDGGNLQGAFLFGANLQRASLSRANLQGANLYEAQLQGANLENARLQGVNLFRASLQEANLSGARLQAANLGGTNLSRARLCMAGLQGAVLGGTNLEEADLSGARLQRANLEGARLQGATLTDATCDENTILPDGTRWTPDTDMARFTEPERFDLRPSPAGQSEVGGGSG